MMSWYLNIIHPGWQGLILQKDHGYHAIMPVLGKKKWWFGFHPNPPLAQQLGLTYTDSTYSDDLLSGALKFLKRKFILFKYPLSNDLEKSGKLKFEVEQHNNYFLKLNKSYEELHSNYRRDRKSRLRQAKNSRLIFNNSGNCIQLIKLFRSEIAGKITGGVSERTIDQILMIAEHTVSHDLGFIAEITNTSKEVLSTALFLKFKNRLIYFMSATTRNGKVLHANTFLIDSIIKAHIDQHLIIDFEGSHIPGIADFYTSFGAKPETYYLLNHENWFVRKLMGVRHWLQNYI